MAVAAVEQGSVSGLERGGRVAAVRLWLYVLAGLVVAMVAVGGATRLTGSGLSITEWRPVTGAIPPLSQEAWAAAFDKYRQIPQYDLVNKGMTLGEFKVIYAWEWSHRQLGRLIGLAFFVPLVWFWAKGIVRGRLALALLALGGLGGLQGAIGWIMVASGLEPGMTAVAASKLALHLLTASLILAGLVWLATGLGEGRSRASPQAADGREGATIRQDGADSPAVSPPSRAGRGGGHARSSLVLVGLILLQIALGGLVAGSKAGFTYNTWPLMDGALMPPAAVLFSRQPWIENVVDNLALVQFNHRLMAYLVVAVALWQAVAVGRAAPQSPAARRTAVIAGLALTQMTLGILTLILVAPLWAGLSHQILAMGLLALAVAHARKSREPFRSRHLGEARNALPAEGVSPAGA